MKSDDPKFTSAREPGRGYHDIGGLALGPVDPKVTEARPWEKLSVVLGNAIGRGGSKVISVDEVRRSREEMGNERVAVAVCEILDHIDAKRRHPVVRDRVVRRMIACMGISGRSGKRQMSCCRVVLCRLPIQSWSVNARH